MQFTSYEGAANTIKTDLLVRIFAKGEKVEVPSSFEDAYKAAKTAGDLPTEFRKSCLLYPAGRSTAKRMWLLCAGEKKRLDPERLRRLSAMAAKRAEALGAVNYVLGASKSVLGAGDPRLVGVAFGEGAYLGSYKYKVPSHKKAERPKCGKGILMSDGAKLPKALCDGVSVGVRRAKSVCFARDLGNKGGNLLTPSMMASEARKLANAKVKVKVLSEADMKRLKMGALLGVSRGSAEPAKLICMDYHPRGAKKTVCVVGKGLTFDAGGISLKPGAGMDEMRYDMCGGGAVLGLMHALSTGAAKSKYRVVGIVPSSENLPDGKAQKPGDIVTAMNGKTIDVLNTDAEGRLILADALCYAVKTYKPDAIVDLATLTGAVIVALGHEVSAAIGNNQKLVDEVRAAGEVSGDRMWQLPLWDVHRRQMKGRYADLRNINSGKMDGGGSISGGAFLENFVDGTPWVHLDIAGTAWNAKAKDYYTSGATGAGVRALCDWVEGRK